MTQALQAITDPQKKIIWIYGKAGTGKSTFLNYIRIKVQPANTVYLAPTGISALLINGQTLHSFFQIEPADLYYQKEREFNNSLLNKLSNLQLIIIDEISMVRADLHDEIDYVLRKATEVDRPFGDIKMLFLGDPYQLPPVVDADTKKLLFSKYKSEYFFSSHVIRDNIKLMNHFEFTKVFRQQDDSFLNALSNLRLGKEISRETLDYINSRQVIDEKIPEKIIRLTGTRKQAEKYNLSFYDAINEDEHTFIAFEEGNTKKEEDLPCPRKINLKIGTQILLIANDKGKNYVNGTIATITAFRENYITAITDKGKTIFIEKHTWKTVKFELKDGEIIEKPDYIYIQYPILYGWAMTIHKAQGRTLDKAYIDLSGGAFSEGQAYVAISRVRSIDDLFLKNKLYSRDFFVNDIINTYFKYYKTH